MSRCIAAYLVKPIRQGERLSAICAVLRRTPQPAVPLVTRHSIHEDRRRLRILLAEDNAVNQTLAVRLLEKRSYSVTVVANGPLAAQTVLKPDFDGTLVYIQMPETHAFTPPAP